MATAHFRKMFKGSCPDCPWERVSNLKSIALTVLELLAFNAKTGLIDWSAAHTHIERKQYLPIHSVHLAEIIIKLAS